MNFIKYKYYLIFPEKKYKILFKNNNLNELKKEFRKINKKYKQKTFILLKLTKNKIKQKSSIKFFSGPIKVDIVFYETSIRGSLKINKQDHRNNFLYYTEDYLKKHKINKKDIKKIAKGAYNDKLETRLLAPKSIDQIKKLKL